MDGTGRRRGGLLAGGDLAGWRASVEEPVTFQFRGMTVCKTGPWGQRPVLLQQVAMLDGLGIERLRPGSAEFIHVVTEDAKLAFADREAWYGDPGQSAIPLAELLSPGYAQERRGLVGESASAELRPGSPGGAAPRLPDFARPDGVSPRPGSLVGAGEPTASAAGAGLSAPELGPGDTCHLDVTDRFGNMVSATPSGGWLQSSPVIPGLGFCLGTRAQMFTLTPGLAATIAPRRRPRTTLSPALALPDGEPYLAFGTPGGDQQDQWSLAFFLNHVLFGMNLQQAIDAPAFHTDHFPSSFWPRGPAPRSLAAEARLGKPLLAELRRRLEAATLTPPRS